MRVRLGVIVMQNILRKMHVSQRTDISIGYAMSARLCTCNVRAVRDRFEVPAGERNRGKKSNSGSLLFSIGVTHYLVVSLCKKLFLMQFMSDVI